MKARYSERMPANGHVLITVGSHVSEGRILDLCMPGGLIESPVSVKKGDSLQLKLMLPDLKASFAVALATVRWTKGFRFGVEFLKMNERDQRQLTQVLTRHRPTQAGTPEGARKRFSDPAALD